MKTNDTTYIGRVLDDGHLSLDKKVAQNLHLKEGDELEVTLRKLEDEKNIVSDQKFSEEAADYVNYLIGSGIKGENLKNVIKEIRNIDEKFQTMSRNEIIKEAFGIAEQRAKAWFKKHGLKPDQLSENELLDTINKIRDSD